MLIFSKPDNTMMISRSVASGKLQALAKGIYITSNADAEREIKEKIEDILIHLKIEGTVSYESGLSYFGTHRTLWVNGQNNRTVDLGPLKIVVTKTTNDTEGATKPLAGTMLRIPNIYRAVLQNFTTKKLHIDKCDRARAFEIILAHANEVGWQVAEANLKTHAEKLGYDKEYKLLAALFTEYKKTFDVDVLDGARVTLFADLLEKLEQLPIPEFAEADTGDMQFCDNMAFIESYFSNYIEGTEFEVGEAYAIIFNPEHHYTRAKDGHDIQKSFSLMKNNIHAPVQFKSASHYIDTLKSWHQTLMSHRSDDMIVGNFKKIKNKAGSTVFVVPQKVEAMLRHSYNLSEQIKDPIRKAYFLKATFTEIHPFEDGNGRMSRIILNNGLSLAGKRRIIIPNVFRDDYIMALKAFSNHNPVPIMRAINKAGLITNSIPYEMNSDDLIAWLTQNSAFQHPNDSIWGALPPKISNDTEHFGNLLKNLKSSL